MSCTMNPRMAVTKEVEEAAPPRYGLLSAATVVESMPAHAHNGIEYVVNCDPGLGLYPTGPGQCEPGQPPTNPTKAAVPGRAVTRADPFAIYGAEPCILGNQDENEARLQLRRRLQRGERHLIEQAVDSGYAGARPYLRHPDADLVTDEPLTLDDAIGVLEHRIAETGRAGTIHAPRWAAPRLDDAGVIHRDGPRMRTALGNSVALGSGYSGMPPENLEDDGMLWLYATAQVTVRRSDIIEPATWSEGAFNPATNSGFLLAERVYVIDWPCHTWVVPTTVERPYTPAPPTASAPALTISHEGNTAPLQVDAHVSNWGSGPVELDWGDGSEVETVDDGGDTTHTYTEAGTYTITATSQQTGGASTTRRVRVVAPLAAPTDVQIQASSPVEATATWEFESAGGPDPTGFEVRWRPSGGSWSQRTRLGAQARSWPLPQVEPGTGYEVGVRALTRQETSPEATGTGTTPAHPDPVLTVEPDSGTAPLEAEITVDNHGLGPVTVQPGDGEPFTHPGDGTSTAHTYTGAGTYTITATSQMWEQASATATVTASAPDPVLTVDPTSGETPLEVTASVDNHGNGPVDLAWGEGDPVQVADGASATHTYETAGDYTVTATSQAHPDASAATAVTVTAPEPEPLELAVDPAEGTTDTEFTALVTNHGQGPAELTWGDNSDPVEIEDGASATHTYTEAGEFTVTATDTDDPDRSATTQVTVTAPDNP